MQKHLFVCLLMFCAAVAAQGKTVTGNVIDDTDYPLPGVTVVVQGTTRGTVTDFDGNYQIEVAESDTLRFNFMGYAEQKIAVAGHSNINVKLTSDSQDIDEVIVIAYGTTKKSSFTGAQVKLDADQISVRATSNAMQSMSGRVAGVQVVSTSSQPGSEQSIRVRGFGSISASNNPLIVVDGAPYEGNISQINPQDIENLTVLKDASASAIYGARGANGVVMITTKRGKTEQAQVNLDVRVGYNKNGQKPYALMKDPAQYLETQYRALYNSRIYSGASTADAHDYANKQLIPSLGYNIYTVPEGQRLIGTNFKLNPEATLGYKDGDNYYLPDDWKANTLKKKALRQEYNASVAAQTDRLNYYISFGYLKDLGLIKNSGFERISTRLKADYQASDWLKIAANISYYNTDLKHDINQESASTNNAFYTANTIAPIYPMYERTPDGQIKKNSQGVPYYDYGLQRNAHNSANPAGDFEYDIRKAISDGFYGNWTITLTPIDGLSLSANITTDVENKRSTDLNNPILGLAAATQGYVEVNHMRAAVFNQQYLATYKKLFDSGMSIETLLGYESYESKTQDLSGNNTMVFSARIPELGNAVGSMPSAYSQTNSYATLGIFGRVQVDFGSRYYLSGSFRRDASSCFDPSNRWGTFGSIGGAWAISEESFASALNSLGRFKLRASVGVQGNDDLGRAESSWAYKPYLDTYLISYSGNSESPFAVSFFNKGNKDITWETSNALNIGLEFDILRSKISGTIDYFYRKTTDLLYQRPVSNTLGYASIPTNVGDMVNSGVELELSAELLNLDKLSWQMNLNATYFHNEITNLAPEAKANGGIVTNNNIIKVGGTLCNYYMPQYAGVDPETGMSLYYVDPDNGDYSTTTSRLDAQNADLGTSLPWLYGGFGTQVEAFGFDLSAQFSYQIGGKLFDGSYQNAMHTGHPNSAGFNWHKDILNAWTPENPDTDVPRLSAQDNLYNELSSRYIIKSDYLSLNNVSLGYTLPQDVVQKLHLGRVRLYATADNVFILSARQGFEPRSDLDATNAESATKYSMLRTCIAGIQVSF